MSDSFTVGDRVKTKKKHPCGSEFFVVLRVGADIKIKCEGCGRIVMMPYEVFIKKAKRL